MESVETPQVAVGSDGDHEALAPAKEMMKEMGRDMLQCFREYSRKNPEATALMCVGIGFVLGWKLKPW